MSELESSDPILIGLNGEPIDLDPTDYCAWWVMSSGTRSSSGRDVHLPNAISEANDGVANDPEIEPPAETLCYLSSRKNTSWRVKSHAVLPLGFRDVCNRCASRLERVVDNE